MNRGVTRVQSMIPSVPATDGRTPPVRFRTEVVETTATVVTMAINRHSYQNNHSQLPSSSAIKSGISNPVKHIEELYFSVQELLFLP